MTMQPSVRGLLRALLCGGLACALACDEAERSVGGEDHTIRLDAATADAATDADDAGRSSAGTEGIERDVLRPVSREPTAARIAALTLPPGFALSVFARDLQHARMLAVHDRHVYLTRPMQGDVLLLSLRGSQV